LQGHAIECRIYAEDPEQNFMPSPGQIKRLRIPQGPGVRDDGGVYEGAEVSIYYDPMISKFAVYGRDRNEAIERMRRALQEYEITGLSTTIPFFREVMRNPEFTEGRLDTGFIERFFERRSRSSSAETDNSEQHDIAIIAAALQYNTSKKAKPRSAQQQKLNAWQMSVRSV
jgi:acetyl-CoA carboxylase biotin carboxylase subunit